MGADGRGSRIGVIGGTFDPIHHGHLVAASEVERVVLAEPAVSPDYLLVMDVREEGRRLVACLELRPEAGAARAELAADLGARLRTELGVGVEVRVVPPGTVPRSEVGKAVRVVQWTGGDPPLPGLD